MRTTAWASLTLAVLLAPLAALQVHAAPAQKPNIHFILADDLGYGDVSCYNDRAKVPTPNLDRLAPEGMRSTDAQSPATVCTPSRYSLIAAPSLQLITAADLKKYWRSDHYSELSNGVLSRPAFVTENS
jgi:hypothetical protein